MRVLGANFLIDYLNGDPDVEAHYKSNGGDKELWVMPAPAYAETLVGVGNHPTEDVDRAIEALSWGELFDIDKDLSVEAARIADESGQQRPYLDGIDALVAAVGHELDVPVVSADGNLTHEETKKVIDVDEY